MKMKRPTMESMKISEEQAKGIAISFSNVLKKCKVQQKKLDACDSENECAKASMDLTMCMGPVLCPVQHKSLLKTLEADDDDKIEASLETLSECVLVQTAERKLAENKYPNLFKK